MIDWTKSQRQTFAFRTVSRDTWQDDGVLEGVTSCTITRDAGTSLLESASMAVDDYVGGERYVRVYMDVEQGWESDRIALGTFLMQSAGESLDGKTITRSVDCFSPLKELDDALMPIGYFVRGGDDVVAAAIDLMDANMHAPIQGATVSAAIEDDYVAELDESVLEYVTSILAKARMHLALDPYGRVSVEPDVEGAALGIEWAYDDGNSSIMHPEVTVDADWYGIPNVVEVVISKPDSFIVGRAVNDVSSSPTSTVARGREVVHRDTNPDMPDSASQEAADELASTILGELSSLEKTVTVSHGYNGVGLRGGVSLDYARHGMRVPRAMVSRQTITCDTGCTVADEATYTESLWRR